MSPVPVDGRQLRWRRMLRSSKAAKRLSNTPQSTSGRLESQTPLQHFLLDRFPRAQAGAQGPRKPTVARRWAAAGAGKLAQDRATLQMTGSGRPPPMLLLQHTQGQRHVLTTVSQSTTH